MNHIDQLKEQLGNNFQKILKQKRIEKSDILRLKQQAKTLSEYDEKSFKPLFNSITTHVNAMKGILSDERRTKLTDLHKQYFKSN